MRVDFQNRSQNNIIELNDHHSTLPHFEGKGSGSGGMSMREPHSRATEDPHWQCAPIPSDVMDRRVEITG